MHAERTNNAAWIFASGMINPRLLRLRSTAAYKGSILYRMENLQTVGREIYKGNIFDIYSSTDLFVLENADPSLFQLMYIDEGSILARTENSETSIFAPVLLCINYREPIERLTLSGTKGFSVFFKPGVINHGLVAESFIPESEAPSGEPGQSAERSQFRTERVLLSPFLKTGKNPYPLPVNGTIRNRILRMHENLHVQLVSQPDQFWPCRGRSFFLEMLMLLQSMYAIENNLASLPIRVRDEFYPVVRDIHVHYPEPDFVCRPDASPPILGSLFFPYRFRRSVGTFPSLYIKHLRCSVGANLLKNTMLALGEIARRCGYMDEKRFAGDFRSVEGIHPLDWRSRFPNPYG